MKSNSDDSIKKREVSVVKPKSTHGSATIFFCIVLSVIIPLTGILIDLVRYRLATEHVKKAVQITADSLLSQYNRPLREEYGVFSIAADDRKELTDAAYEIFNANLTPYLQDGVKDLYQFKVQKLDVIPLKNLSEADVLEQQIVEFMKYRAPLQLSANFFEKIGAFYQATEETEIISSNIILDRELEDIRADRVHLSMMIREIIPQIGVEDQAQTANIRERIETVLDQNRVTMTENMKKYEKASYELNSLLSEARTLYRTKEQANSIYDTAQSNLLAAAEKVDIAEKDVEKAESKEDEDDANKVLAYAMGVENTCKNALTGAKNRVESSDSAYNSFLSEKWEPVASALQTSLTALQGMRPVYVNELQGLTKHLRRFQNYIMKTIQVVNTLSEKTLDLNDTIIHCNDLSETTRAGGTTGRLASSLAGALPGDDLLPSITSSLNDMNDKITNWILEAERVENRYHSRFNEIDTIVLLVQPVIANPTSEISGSIPSFSLEFANEEWGSNALSGIADLAKGVEMKKKGIMLIPDYPIKPVIQEVEVDEFYEWFTSWSGETFNESSEELSVQKKESKKQLKALRSAASDTAELVQNANTSKVDESPVVDNESAKNLPTGENGYSGSFEQIAEIGELMEDAIPSILYEYPIYGSQQNHGMMNERQENIFTNGIQQISEFGRQMESSLSDASGGLMKSIYTSEYALSAFKNRLSEGQLEYDIGWDRHIDETAFTSGEVEYILFGKFYESKNINAMKYALFATRLAFNLLHVYTTPEKESAALALATTLAGWTVFGIPVVYNFLMISWAAAEAYVDVDKLLKGEDVPIVKTSANWYLGANGIKEEFLQNLLLKPAREEVSGWVGIQVNTANTAIQEEVGCWIDSGVDAAFAQLESQCSDYGERFSEELADASKEIPGELAKSIATFATEVTGADTDNMMIETFEQKLSLWLDTLRNTCTETIKSESTRQILAWKMQIKTELKDAVFQSVFYKNLVTTIKKEASTAIDNSFDTIEDHAEKMLGKTLNKTGLKDGISGKMLTMNYRDYLSLFMLTIPQDVKISRIGDLMQMNIAQIAEEPTPMKERQTAIFIKAEVTMNYWFLSDALMKKSRYGKISAEWGQSY